MKLASTFLASALADRQLQRNLRSLAKYLWLPGVLWTFTVMSTLGFGDIT